MKLYTVAAALDRLSPDYKFSTSVYATTRPDSAGVVHGNLTIYGRGDPSIAARFNNGDYYKAIDDLATRIVAAGVKRVGRTVGVQNGRPVLEDGRTLDVTNVVWCTGYHPGFSWIELPVFDADGEPLQDRGVVRGEPGLYFVGLHFLYAMSSGMIHGVGRDADHVADTIARRPRTLLPELAHAASA